MGKGTVVRRLLELNPGVAYSISCTTREPRPGEVDGRDYRFVSASTFQERIDEGAFLEWADVFGHRYGTLAGPVDDEIRAGRDVVLEIDVQGAEDVRRHRPEAVLIFLAAPSDEEHKARLRSRGTEGEAELARRLSEAQREMDQAVWFDHVVVNDQIDRAAREVASIIEAASRDDVPATDEDGVDDRTEDR